MACSLAKCLREMGHVVCAIEATEAGAVAAAAQFGPDLMIVDAQLRDGSGVIAVEEILQTGFIPHVFVSGARSGRLEQMRWSFISRFAKSISLRLFNARSLSRLHFEGLPKVQIHAPPRVAVLSLMACAPPESLHHPTNDFLRPKSESIPPLAHRPQLWCGSSTS